MNYSETLEYIHGINKYAKKLGLENIRALMRELGDPQDRLRFIHIAGTNGKGSTAALISSVTRAAGYRTGLYTSPYLRRFTERIRVDGAEIPECEVVRLAGAVREAISSMTARGCAHPTELEVVAAIAFLYYEQTGCEVVVFEVGLGGRFDPTNVINTPLAAAIATIDYDHVRRLGGTLPEIAYEKAGIIKAGGDVALYPQQADVMEVFTRAAETAGARLHVCDFSSLGQEAYGLWGQRFGYRRRDGFEISLAGDFQMKNAALAIETVEIINRNSACGIRISDGALRRGLREARWPGRTETLRERPTVIVDSAHNAQGARALRDTLEKYCPGRNKIFIIGVLKDKDYMSIIEPTLPLASAVFTVTPESARAMDAAELADILRASCASGLTARIRACGTVREAAERALGLAGDGDVICAFGSMYYIGAFREYFGYE